MRSLISALAITMMTLIICCSDNDEPNYSIEPYIEPVSLSFTKGDSQSPDTLHLQFYFRDGDMDLGTVLDAKGSDDPYHSTNYFLADGLGGLTTIGTKNRYSYLPDFITPKSGQKGKLVTHRTRKSIQAYADLLPPYESPYTCTTYRYDSVFVSEENADLFDENTHYIGRVIKSGNPDLPRVYVLKDTFYYQINPNYFGIDIQILKEKSDSQFEEEAFPPSGPFFCSNRGFSSRLPSLESLAKGFEVRNGAFTANGYSKQDGLLTYNMISSGIALAFRGQKIKVRVTIKDRALHISNTIETNAVDIP